MTSSSQYHYTRFQTIFQNRSINTRLLVRLYKCFLMCCKSHRTCETSCCVLFCYGCIVCPMKHVCCIYPSYPGLLLTKRTDILPQDFGKSETARLDVIIMVSLWNFTGILAALLSMCLSNYRTIKEVQTRISRLRGFMRSCSKKELRWKGIKILNHNKTKANVNRRHNSWYMMRMSIFVLNAKGISS